MDNTLHTLADNPTTQNPLPDRSEFHKRIALPDGSIYRGDMLNHRPQGQGISHYSDGSRYEGSFNEGKREGVGSQEWKEGRKYKGE